MAKREFTPSQALNAKPDAATLTTVATLEDIGCHLQSLVGLCFTLADNTEGDPALTGTFYSLGNALEHEHAALQCVIEAGIAKGRPSAGGAS